MTTGTRLVGRDTELAAFGDAVARARGGSPACVVIEGEAGIGKSSLVSATVENYSQEGDLIAFGHGVELAGGELPYGVGAEMLRHLVREAGVDAVRAAAGQYGVDLEALHPALGAQPQPYEEGRRPPETTPARLLPAFVSTMEALAADRPVWLVIEDLQWVDGSSRDLLNYLVRVVSDCHLLLAVTVRTDDRHPDPAAADMASALAALPNTARIAVQPLAADELATLVANLTDGEARPSHIARLVSLSQGNPMLTEQLVAGGPSVVDIPASVLAPMAARLRGLDHATRHLLHVASLGEGHLAHRLLLKVYEQTVEARARHERFVDYDTAVGTAIAERLLSFDPRDRSFAFTHALLRHAADVEITPGDRLEIHRAWAQVLSAPGNHGDDPYLQIAAAHHWFDSDSDDEAFDAAITAAEYATRLQASAETAVLLRRALTLWDRVVEPRRRYPAGRDELIMDVATAYDDCDQLVEACRVLDTELKRSRSDKDQLRTSCLRAARGAYGDWVGEGQAPDIARELLHQRFALSAASPSSLVYWGLRGLGGDLWPNNPGASLQACRDSVEVARQLRNPRHLQGALSELQFHLVNAGGFDETLAAIEPALEQARGHDPLGVLNLAGLRCATLHHAGRFIEAREAMTAGRRQLPDRRLYPAYWAFSCRNLALPLEALGEWDRVKELQQETHRAGATENDAVYMLAEWEGTFACAVGDFSAADERLRELRATERDDTWYLYLLRTTHLEAAIAAGRRDYAAARDLLAPSMSPEHPTYLGEYWPAALTAATVQADRGRTHGGTDDEDSKALRSIRALVEHLPRTGPYNAARYLHARAALAHAQGDDAPEMWDEVTVAWRNIAHQPLLGWALARLAEAHARTGAKITAADRLAEAWELGQRLGATPLCERVIDVARRAHLRLEVGKSARPRTTGVLARLTDRELEVLEHIAAGETNDELAAALFISPKTVSVHVSHILAKLEVTTRAKATAIAYQEGLF